MFFRKECQYVFRYNMISICDVFVTLTKILLNNVFKIDAYDDPKYIFNETESCKHILNCSYQQLWKICYVSFFSTFDNIEAGTK